MAWTGSENGGFQLPTSEAGSEAAARSTRDVRRSMRRRSAGDMARRRAVIRRAAARERAWSRA
jgi:hypothetical protein